jgi:hypothetical protein
MRHRIIAAIVLLTLAAGPLAVHAQESPAPSAVDALEGALLERLCSADQAAEADLAACLLEAADALTGGAILASPDDPAEASPDASPEADPSAASQDRLAQAREAVDQALATARQSVDQIDLQAAIDDAVASARDVDLRAALDEAVAAVEATGLQARLDEALTAASEVDVEAALAEAQAAVEASGLQAALDDALASVEDAIPDISSTDVEVLLATGVLTARAVIVEAQAWAQENSDTICKGGSLGLSAAVAVVVAHLTGDPALAAGAFGMAERLSSDVCQDVAQ